MGHRRLTAVLVIVGALGVPSLALAGQWHLPVKAKVHLNHWARGLGLGWSDGYHAVGSPYSWSPGSSLDQGAKWFPTSASWAGSWMQSQTRTPRAARQLRPLQVRRLPPVQATR